MHQVFQIFKQTKTNEYIHIVYIYINEIGPQINLKFVLKCMLI